MQMISRLTHAVEENRFTLYTQAIEPLFRGRAPTHAGDPGTDAERGRGHHHAAAFIPAAERFGIMPSIDRWVLRETCRQLSRENVSTSRICSINVSNQSLCEDNFLDFVLRQFEESGVDPGSAASRLPKPPPSPTGLAPHTSS